MEVEYELAQQLQGHESQVRCVAVLSDDAFVTGGLDAQVLSWRRTAAGSFELHRRLGHHSDFVYALAGSASFPGGFYSGSKDRSAFRLDAEGNPAAQFLGHEGPVCSLVERGQQLVTGAWDGTARVWDAATGELRQTLDAGAHAVAVAVLADGQVVTGSQDRSLRVFRDGECVHRINEAHGDIIRAISAAPTHLVTASNDNLLKMWSLDGCEMAQLVGHQSFVYGVAHSADAQTILSSSDDCTLRLWAVSDLQCRQSVLHAATVWQSAALPSGDVVTCCADAVARVWTRDPARFAAEAERVAQREQAEQAALQAAGKGSSSGPMEGAVDIALMPTTAGKKNGEIRCFRDGAVVFAFSWNAGARCWDKIGEVVGHQSEKKFYDGDSVFPRGEYDFVFDVDMGASLGMRKLPYNRGQNPMQVAESFCAREQIHKGNIDQIRQFIVQNGGGDGPVNQAAQATAQEPSSLFPIMTPATFREGKFEPLQSKILEFNDQVEESLRLDPTAIAFLKDAISKLKTGVTTTIRNCEKEVIHVQLKEWPRDRLFPVIDLWRLFLVHPQSADYFKGSDRGTPFIVWVLSLLASDSNGALGLCSARYLANLFIYQTNRYAAFDKREIILKGMPAALASTNKHTRVAAASVLLNLAIVLHESSAPPKPWDAAGALAVAKLSLDAIAKAGPDDADMLQRAVLAVGTLLPRDRQHGGAVARACLDADLPRRMAATDTQPFAKAAAEVRALLS